MGGRLCCRHITARHNRSVSLKQLLDWSFHQYQISGINNAIGDIFIIEKAENLENMRNVKENREVGGMK